MTIEEKRKLRKEFEEKANEVKENERIHIDKDLLEQLLFDNVDKVYNGYKNNEFNKPAKYVTWSTPLLSKIDLSEISFEDVVWNNYFSWYENSKKIFTDQPEKINLSNTNAKIDLKKSFIFKNTNLIAIENCDFKGTDLSNNNLKDLNGIIIDSDLSSTNIDIPLHSPSVIYMGPKIYVYNTDLSNNDFSKYTLDTCELDNYGCDYEGTIFNNTGVNFVSGMPINLEYLDKNAIKRIEGCYINGEPSNKYIEKQRLEDRKDEIEDKIANMFTSYSEKIKLQNELEEIENKLREFKFGKKL